MKSTLLVYTLLLLTLIEIVSCKKDSSPATAANTITFKATLNGENEIPASSSVASGTATFTYNTTSYVLSGTVNYAGVLPTAAHIQKGAAGVAGVIVFPVGTSPYTSPISFTTVTLTAGQTVELMAGMYYVNIDSKSFPNGEIRGQIVEQTSGTSASTGGY
jgi:hypothetical protein